MKRLLFLILAVCTCGWLIAGDDYSKHVLYYSSIDQHGDSLTVSGLITVPNGRAPKGIILVPHYTINATFEAPSVKPTTEAKYFGKDYVLLMPDYIGFGITADRIHPYLHGELVAHNCVDMVLGAREMLDSLKVGLPWDSIYIVGYSQGGASAVWTLRLIEEQYGDKIHVRRCFAGAGPYDVAVTYDDGIATNHVTSPMVIPLLLIGTDAAYDLHIVRSRFFTPAMEKVYQKYIKNKNHGIVDVFFRTLNHKLSHWLTPEAMDKNNANTKHLYEGLRRSSIVGDSVCPPWTPKAPLYMFHSTEDDIVTFKCAEHFKKCYPDQPNIIYDFGDWGGHLKSSYIFYSRVKDRLADPSFDGLE